MNRGIASLADSIELRDRRWATFGLMLATALQAADATIVNVALPHLTRDLGGGIELGAWVMTTYLCAAAIVAPLTGWLRRRFGPRRLYIGAMGLFVAASLLCAVAPNAATIILFRTLQGAGGGIIPALAQAVLHDLYPRERHGRVLAVWGAVAMLGPILGPALGGVITDLSSWRWVFLINLPLGALAIFGIRNVLRHDDAAFTAPIDTVGLLLLIAGIGSLQLALQRGVGKSWLHSPELLAESCVAGLALIALIARTHQRGPTILRLEVFRDPNFAAAAFFNFTTSALLFTSIVFVPILVQGPLGYPATVAGFTIVPRGILMMLMILAVGRIIHSIDFRFAVGIGSLLLTGGLCLLADPWLTGDLTWLVIGSSVLAMGAGTILMPLSTYAFATLPSELRTDGAGLYSLLRQIGCAAGVAVMTAILQIKLAASGGSVANGSLGEPATLAAFAWCFRIMAIAAVAAMPVMLLFRPPLHPIAAAPEGCD